MTFFLISVSIVSVVVIMAAVRRSRVAVPEDHNAVVVNRQGFVKRVLPAGSHLLKPGLEKIEFTFSTKTQLVMGTADNIPTNDGVLLAVQWSGTYTPNPEFITDKVSQRLRGLPKAQIAVARQVDLTLRRLVGVYTLQELFKPIIRQRIERQLTEAVKSMVRPGGIALNAVNLQAIIPPEAVSVALNQAQAIHALDQAIRASDGATRHMVAGAHQLEELIEWGQLLPPYGRYMLAKPPNREKTTIS